MNLGQLPVRRGLRKGAVIVLAGSALAATLLYPGSKIPGVVECVPEIFAAANAPRMQPYVSEFSGSHDHRWTEPRTNNVIKGTILHEDTNSACGQSLILAYEGQYWTDRQRLYFQSQSEEPYITIEAFRGKNLVSASFVPGSDCSDGAILAEVGYGPWAYTLWRLDLRSNKLERLTSGTSMLVSPDRTMVFFRRTDDHGFHSFHLLDLKSGQIENVISMWEGDPGSGTSFDCDWSKDSRAVNIYGSTSGFYRRRERGYLEFNLIYSASEKKMYSISPK